MFVFFRCDSSYRNKASSSPMITLGSGRNSLGRAGIFSVGQRYSWWGNHIFGLSWCDFVYIVLEGVGVCVAKAPKEQNPLSPIFYLLKRALYLTPDAVAGF